jgi:hypothetical protein
MTTTPPNASIPLQVHETPAISRRTSQWKYLTGQLDLARLAVMEDLRSIPVVPLKFLFDHVLPPLPSTLDLHKLQASLRSENVAQENGWRGFEIPPKGSEKQESVVFQPLVRVFNDVLKLAKRDKTLSPVLRMRHSPNSAPFSKRANSSKPDGFLELLERKSVDTEVGKSNWEDIPVSMEFKKSDSDAENHDVSLVFVCLDLLYPYSMHLSRIEPRSSGAYTI